MVRRSRVAVVAGLAAALVAGLVVALLPERPARPLTPPDGWEVRGRADRLPLVGFPEPYRQLRRSVAGYAGGVLYRSWTPEAGAQDIEVVSPPFRAPRHLSVAITGSTRTVSGTNTAYLSCSEHAGRLPIFSGSVNINVAEAIVSVPRGWCPGDARLHLSARDRGFHVGVGTAFAISSLSVWKSSFLGLLPFLALSLAIPCAIGLAGAAAARRWVPGLDAPLAAGASIGLAAAAAFFRAALLPAHASAAVPPLAAAAAIALLRWPGRRHLRSVAAELAPYAKAWVLAALAYFALLCAARNGLGHWEPCYRFWPASWSSDHELPWIFAEAVRTGEPFADLFRPWLPTDRPPLMAGAHLLFGDLFAWMRAADDGPWRRGLAYNAVSVSFNALWVPAALFLLVAVLRLPMRRAALVAAVVGTLPFALFNTIYGWPKALGAAFGIAAAAVALLAVRPDRSGHATVHAAAFGALSALSLLAHGSGALFLLPVAAWLFFRFLARRPRALLAGLAVGFALLGAWALYQRLVLPSRDPITRFALTGDYGFDGARGLGSMLLDRYRALGLAGWLEVKARMLLQPLLVVDQAVFQIRPNRDAGSDALGALRARDALLLSGGNSPILLTALAALAGSGWVRRRMPAPAPGAQADPAATRTLILLALASWLLLDLLFLVPLVLPTWPYAAAFTLGCAGLGWVACRAPRAFAGVAAAVALYSGVIWIWGPLRAAQEVDAVALAALGLAALAGASSLLRPAPERAA